LKLLQDQYREKLSAKHFDLSVPSADSVWQFLPLLYDAFQKHYV